MHKPICAFHTAKLQTFPHPARVLAKKNLLTKKPQTREDAHAEVRKPGDNQKKIGCFAHHSRKSRIFTLRNNKQERNMATGSEIVKIKFNQ